MAYFAPKLRETQEKSFIDCCLKPDFSVIFWFFRKILCDFLIFSWFFCDFFLRFSVVFWFFLWFFGRIYVIFLSTLPLVLRQITALSLKGSQRIMHYKTFTFIFTSSCIIRAGAQHCFNVHLTLYGRCER